MDMQVALMVSSPLLVISRFQAPARSTVPRYLIYERYLAD